MTTGIKLFMFELLRSLNWILMGEKSEPPNPIIPGVLLYFLMRAAADARLSGVNE